MLSDLYLKILRLQFKFAGRLQSIPITWDDPSGLIVVTNKLTHLRVYLALLTSQIYFVYQLYMLRDEEYNQLIFILFILLLMLLTFLMYHDMSTNPAKFADTFNMILLYFKRFEGKYIYLT